MDREKQLRIISIPDDDNKGAIFGMEGDLFIFPIGATVIGLGLFISNIQAGTPVLECITASVTPLILTLAYLFIFVVGKPAGYALDLFETLLEGKGYLKNFQKTKTHPLQLSNKAG